MIPVVLVTVVIAIIIVGIVFDLMDSICSKYFDFSPFIGPIAPAPPETADTAESFPLPPERNPLFRHVPELKKQLAWMELGDYPTPVHHAKLKLTNGKRVSFFIKREDLCSNVYGGNKVRALQYQLPACVAHASNHLGKFFVTGSGGSDHVVATLAHGSGLGLNFHVIYYDSDAPDLDNTLNFLSTLSYRPSTVVLWDSCPSANAQILFNSIVPTCDKVIAENSVAGVLGQIGAALELAEQIERNEVPDLDEIFLPMGSACTTAGLVLGICLARQLNMNAFRSQNFKVVSVMTDHRLAELNRRTSVMKNWAGEYHPQSPKFGIVGTAEYLNSICDIDLKAAALTFMENEWEVIDREDIVGQHGTHSEKSAAASAYESSIEVIGNCPPWLDSLFPPPPWLSGQSSGKAFAAMLERLDSADENVQVLLWQTKSYIQPLGDKASEWKLLKHMAGRSEALKTWIHAGKGSSSSRQADINIEHGSPTDYRSLMTWVNL